MSNLNNYEVTFTAKDPCTFSGSYFRRKRFVPLVELILARYIPFQLQYPARVTITGDDCAIKSITISNDTQTFTFTWPNWNNGWYSFDSILAEEINDDHKTKKVLHIYIYGVYYFGKVLLNEAVDIHNASPLQNGLIILKDAERCLPKHYRNSREVFYKLCNFLEENSSFSFLDVVKTVLSVFNMRISDIDVLNIQGVINFYHGRLVSARSYFEDAFVEVHITDDGCEFACATKHSVIKRFPDGCISVNSDLTDDDERNADVQEALEKIEAVRKDVYLIPTK